MESPRKINLTSYQISFTNFDQQLDREQLLRLTLAFNERFPTWNLFVRTHCSLNDRKYYSLYVVKAITTFENDELFDVEGNEMRQFVVGFNSAARHLTK
jgi:hypothetical protein